MDDANPVLTSIIGIITASKIVGVMIPSMKNWVLVAKYVKRILRLKKRNLEAA